MIGVGILELNRNSVDQYIPTFTAIYSKEDKNKILKLISNQEISYIMHIKNPKLKDKYLEKEEIKEKNNRLKYLSCTYNSYYNLENKKDPLTM